MKTVVDEGISKQFEDQERRIAKLESKATVGQWVAGIVGGAILVETVRKLFR